MVSQGWGLVFWDTRGKSVQGNRQKWLVHRIGVVAGLIIDSDEFMGTPPRLPLSWAHICNGVSCPEGVFVECFRYE